jgi:ABC-type multidrug transport system permease subunit
MEVTILLKNLYVLAWFLLAAAVLVSALTGAFNVAALVVFSLIALGLVYTLALWSVTVNTREIKTR